MKITSIYISKILCAFLFAVVIGIGGLSPPVLSAPAPAMTRIQGHIPQKAIANARWMGRLPAATHIRMAFSLPLRNQQKLKELLHRIYDPNDPLYGHYLTPGEFTEKFGPSQADYDAVAAYAVQKGFTVVQRHPNRILLDVSGPAATVEAAFGLQMEQYQAPDSRVFHAPDRNPRVPDAIASRISGIIGLSNAAVWHAHSRFVPAENLSKTAPAQIGTGPGGGLTPGDIRTAYNLNSVSADGSGQTLGLFELDGYKASDVSYYVNYFNLPGVPLQNVLVDGFSGRAGSGASEVTLDIELQIALAPGASRIIVYEGPNSSTGVADTYNRIATDNLARQISTSWGLSEGQSSTALLNTENAIFQQMAAQGQSIFAASGDSGAYDNGSTLSVDDPASQPYMVGTGGTQLFLYSGGTYDHETTWNVNDTVSGGAGGGGISAVWSIPDWQQNVGSVASTTMRNVPDVSLNADQYTGYSIYYKHKWYIFGGTSCASPLWAAFTARVNQMRAASGTPPLGFANPTLYQIGTGADYAADFHDIADGSTNLYYVAGTGYDNATGWGSFNGANLLADLAGTSSATVPLAPANLTAVGGDGTVTLNWTASTGATSYNIYRGTASGAEGTTPIATGITGTTYTDSAVTNGVTYFYEVSATNSAGTSSLSNEASATPGTPSLAITSGPSAKGGKGSDVTVTWTTNLAADSVVQYGTSPGGLDQTVSDGNLVTSHSMTINALSRHTVYYYRVSSTAGGITVSSAVESFRTH